LLTAIPPAKGASVAGKARDQRRNGRNSGGCFEMDLENEKRPQL
jgi:hypothetical protein